MECVLSVSWWGLPIGSFSKELLEFLSEFLAVTSLNIKLSVRILFSPTYVKALYARMREMMQRKILLFILFIILSYQIMMSKKFKTMFKCLVYTTQYRELRRGFKHKKGYTLWTKHKNSFWFRCQIGVTFNASLPSGENINLGM